MSNDDVGEAGCQRVSRTEEEMTTRSSPLDSLLSLRRFLDRKPSFKLIVAFFSWTLANFPMLNLVAIPKIKIQNTKSKKRKSEKGRQPKGNVTFVKSTQLLYFIVSMFFRMKLEGLGPRK